MSENIDVKFHGFSPSDSAVFMVMDILGRLIDEAPYNAIITAQFNRNEEVLKGHLRIHSKARQFFAVAEGLRLDDVSRKLVDRIHKQLDRWKHQRVLPVQTLRGA